jgi:GTPase SAR1 family protein
MNGVRSLSHPILYNETSRIKETKRQKEHMQTASSNIPLERRNPSILLIGPPGGGKTTLMLQFPKVHVVNCDDNLVGPDRYLRSVNGELTYTYSTVPYYDDGKSVPIELCYNRLLELLDEAKASDAETICVDSLTWINEYIIRKIITQQKRTEMEARDWIPFKSAFLSILAGKLRSMGKTTIATVHESIIYQPDPKNIIAKTIVGYEASVQGSIVDYLGAFFTDVWRMEAQLGPLKPAPPGMLPTQEVEYVLTSNRTSKSDLKNSYGLPHTIKNPTFKELNQYMKL